MNSDQKPRILIFSLAYFPWVGGAEIAVKEITDRLGDSFDFDLITLRFNKNVPLKERMDEVNIHRIDCGKLTFPLRAFLLARRLNKKNNYYATWSIMAAYAGFAGLFFKLSYPKIPFLLTLQEGDSEKHILRRVGILLPLWRMIFKKADYIQAISGYLADFGKRHGAIGPIEVVPNGVDLNKFSIYDFQFTKKTEDNNIKTIITTSRLVYKNGIDIFIRAVAELKNKNYSLKAVIVGDGPERSKLEKLVVDLDLSDQVEFLGHIDPNLIPQHLAQADIFVRPSRSEGLGSSFLEAMAAGLPVIGTSVGGIPDFLKDGQTGLFCETDNPNSLAENIVKLIDDKELFKKLSKNGQELINEKYSWDNAAKKLGRIMENFPWKKLLLATGIYPPDIGGPATYAALLKEKLPIRGVRVDVVTYGPTGVSRKWPKGLSHLIYFLFCFKKSFAADIILVQDTISAGLPALLAAKLLGKKIVIRVPGDYVWEQSVQRFGVKDSIDDFQTKKYSWKVELLRKVQKFVVGHTDVVITPSWYFKKLVSGWIKNPNKVRVIYNGIDLDLKSKIAYPKKEKERSMIHEKRFKTIISAGRLVPWKGFDFLIKLMIDLFEWKLIIAGDGPEFENLKSKISNLKLQDRIELLGQITREELMRRMKESDVFILNTHFESFSFQIVEAMAMGLPVVATKIGNLEEIINNGEDGFLVEPDNKEQFLKVLKELSRDSNLYARISKKATEKAQNFSVDNTLNNLVSLFKEIK